MRRCCTLLFLLVGCGESELPPQPAQAPFFASAAPVPPPPLPPPVRSACDPLELTVAILYAPTGVSHSLEIGPSTEATLQYPLGPVAMASRTVPVDPAMRTALSRAIADLKVDCCKASYSDPGIADGVALRIAGVCGERTFDTIAINCFPDTHLGALEAIETHVLGGITDPHQRMPTPADLRGWAHADSCACPVCD